MSLKPIPAPESSLYGYSQSRRLGLRMAAALGRVSPGRWWSQMMISNPRELP